ncbi:MAG: sulfotransferase [Methylohalobius sp.]|nr:sulfotransferase [Methylohalobius sp.]
MAANPAHLKLNSESQRALPFFPDFFLIGAPRCGTTAMSHYLGHHPKICFSKPKEPHFFSLVRERYPELDERYYLERCFAHYDPSRHRVLGEGSVSYLYDPKAIDRILGLNPHARFLVMVRNPIDLVYSYHTRLVALLEEDQEDFATAWRLQEARKHGKYLPKTCLHPSLLQYAEIGHLGKHLARLFQKAGRERCLVVVFDDFVADPLRAYRKVLEFIGIEYDGRTAFPPKESNRYPRFKWLQRWLKRPPKQVENFLATLEHQRTRKRPKRHPLKRLRKFLLKQNLVHRSRPPLPQEFKAELLAVFRQDIALLEELLGRNLSSWKRL